jgi:hypothetical protein
LRLRHTLHFTARVDPATAAMARPARRLAALQLLGIERLFFVVVPCQPPRGTHPDDRPTAPSRVTEPVSASTRARGRDAAPTSSQPISARHHRAGYSAHARSRAADARGCRRRRTTRSLFGPVPIAPTVPLRPAKAVPRC